MIFQNVYDLIFENGTCKTSKNNSLVMQPRESIPTKFIIRIGNKMTALWGEQLKNRKQKISAEMTGELSLMVDN